MKTIQVLDEDYEILMELSKELQTQKNHHQAFPYFWEPASKRRAINPHDEGDIVMIYDHEQAESSTPEEYADCDPEFYETFLDEQEIKIDTNLNIQPYNDALEEKWIEYITENRSAEKYSMDWEQQTEHNPSLFLSDVQNFIKTNKHHLGKDPHTYARSVWRMPKMEKLIGAIFRINPQAKEDVNNEAARIVFNSAN